MSEAKFAKGSWWRDEDNKWDIRGMSRAAEAPPERWLRPCVVCSVNSWLVSADANAELLKAAPEMYEMLDAIAPILRSAAKGVAHDEGHVWPETLSGYADTINNLLAKARGEP